MSAGFHDAALCAIRDGEIKFAGHAERYSLVKHDPHLNYDIFHDAVNYAGYPDTIAYYEKPWLKKTRQLYSGELSKAFSLKDITAKQYLKNNLPQVAILDSVKFKHVSHHLSHAAAGFQTSKFKEATVVVIDAIGEWDCVTIWGAEYDSKGFAKYKKLYSKKYPHSLGLMYSAFTDHVGLKPMDEEYILMGMAGYGKLSNYDTVEKTLVVDENKLDFSYNMHTGFLDTKFLEGMSEYDVAACAQVMVENLICSVMEIAKGFHWSSNLVYMGGVALNCLANRLLGAFFHNVWIMPNPGDAGSALGAAAYAYGKQLDWQHPYLGTSMGSEYPVSEVIQELFTNKIVGVATGRAEFGPRALGNRSLLADPRGAEIKDKVNEIKRRQKFRPFAPMILEEYVNDYFEMPCAHGAGFPTSPYMQVVAKCKFPDQFPAIIHVDGTSRVQTVGKDCGSGVRQLLEEWYKLTGCPMLLNTSLNIRGEPMVNTRKDADRFEQLYNVKVVS